MDAREEETCKRFLLSKRFAELFLRVEEIIANFRRRCLHVLEIRRLSECTNISFPTDSLSFTQLAGTSCVFILFFIKR